MKDSILLGSTLSTRETIHVAKVSAILWSSPGDGSSTWLILRRLRTAVHFWKRWGRITKGCGTMTEKGWFVGCGSALINRMRNSPVRRGRSICIAACYPSLRPTTKSSWKGSEPSTMMILSLPFTPTRTIRSATFICMFSPETSFCANFRQKNMIGKRSQLNPF